MTRNLEEVSCGNQGNHSGEDLTESRSSEQLEHGVPSTYPTFWHMDDDDDGGPTTSQLYGMYTWNIEDFSRIKRRELCSNVFKIGGYEWYILIYPQGCDACDHLSLFLCVANHDKLLPGWSPFAQFTLAVVNKDPKRTKYSDTLHQFWKNEHDWGWKRFMEFSRVNDGFIDANSLIVKAQIQVIRERAERPFRCLDCQYRRELIRVYLTDVEAICRHLLEQRRTYLGKLVKDELSWLSFCSLWREIDQKRKYLISREKSDAVLSVAVQSFYIKNEVSWTLVMDSLYSGLKYLEWMSKNKSDKEKLTNTGESVVPMVILEREMFILVDDVLPLIERAAIEPLPPKDDKGPQDRTKDGCSEEDLIKDTIEYYERRLTELGRKTIEIVALSQILSKIKIAMKEVVSLKRQELLICEEEAEAKHGIERDKKSKKKQRKSEPSGRKAKGGKGRDETTNLVMVGRNDTTLEDENDYENPITGDDISYSSDSLDSVTEVPQHDSLDSVTEAPQLDSDDRGFGSVCSDTDTPAYFPDAESINNDSIQNGQGEKKVPSSSTDDRDSLLTCSTDLVPSLVRNGSDREYLQTNQETQKPPVRNELHGLPSETVICSARLSDAEPNSVPQSFTQPDNKKKEVTSPQRTLAKGIPFKETTTRPSPPRSLPQNITSNNVSIGKRPMLAGSTRCTSKPDLGEAKYPKPIEKPSVEQVQVIPSLQTPPPDLGEATDQKPPSLETPSVLQVPVVSSLQTPQLDLGEVKDPKPSIKKPSVLQVPVNSPLQKPLPLLEQSVSAAVRLGSDLSPFAPCYIPKSSHPNATMDDSDCFHQDSPFDEEYQPPIPIERNPSFGIIGRPHSSVMPAAQTTQNVAMPKFPYVENLLDDENGMERFPSSVNNSEHHNLTHQFSVPGNTRTWGGDRETSSSYHDYVSSPLTLSGPLDRRNQGPPGFDGNQRQIVEPELSMRMGTRNIEPDGLSHGGIPGNDHELNMRMRVRNIEPDGLSSYGGIPGDDPELSMRMKLRNRELDGLSSYGGIPGDDPELSMRMRLSNREPDGLSSFGGIPMNDSNLGMRMRNNEPNRLSYGDISRNDLPFPPHTRSSMRNNELDVLPYGVIPINDPELSMRMRNRESSGLSYGGIPGSDPPSYARLSTRMGMRNSDLDGSSYVGIPENNPPPHTRLNMRNREPDVLSYSAIPGNNPPPHTRVSMRNTRLNALSYNGIPIHTPLNMRNNELDVSSYNDNPPPHTLLNMRNNEPDQLSHLYARGIDLSRLFPWGPLYPPPDSN